MAKYRKKPVVVEAIEWTGSNLEEVEGFLGVTDRVKVLDSIFIRTLEGLMETHVGDYIIKGVHGEFYPCKPDIFRETYELVEVGE